MAMVKIFLRQSLRDKNFSLFKNKIFFRTYKHPITEVSEAEQEFLMKKKKNNPAKTRKIKKKVESKEKK